MERRLNLTDATIQIRIMKALEDIKPFGVFKHFYAIRTLRNLKQPNIITSLHIWEFLRTGFDMERYNERADRKLKENAIDFEEIFRE